MNNKQSFLSQIKYISACPFCGMKLNASQAKIISQNDNSSLIHVSCNKCKCSVLASLAFNPMGISSIGLATDLTYSDVIKFKNAPIITADHILEAYSQFKKFIIHHS